MVKILRIKGLEARKRSLVSESEVYRQTLTLEIQNIRLYGARMRRKLGWVRWANPLLLLAGSIVGSRFFRRRATPLPEKRGGKWSRLIGSALFGWRLYRQVAPFIPANLFQQFMRPKGRSPAPFEDQ